MPMKPGQTELSREQRQTKIYELIEAADAKNIEHNKPDLLKLVIEAGFNISLPTLYNDLRDIAREDPFIQDLASKNYSSIMHRSFKRYNKIYDLAMLIHDSENQLTRQISRDTKDGLMNETIKDHSGTVKLQALNTAKAAQDSIRTMVNGENLHISSSKWQLVTKQQEATIKQLKEKLGHYEEQTPRIKTTD